jgi:hypothetical protein
MITYSPGDQGEKETFEKLWSFHCPFLGGATDQPMIEDEGYVSPIEDMIIGGAEGLKKAQGKVEAGGAAEGEKQKVETKVGAEGGMGHKKK